MRVLVVGRDLPSKENNMLGSFEYEQAQMLARHGHDVYYFYIDLRSIRHWRKFGFDVIKKDGVNLVTINVPIGRALPADIRNRLYSPLRNYQLKTFGKRYGVPDIVSVHYPSLYNYDIFSPLQLEGAKVVGIEHWSKVLNNDLTISNLKNLNDFAKKADALACVGSALKDAIVKLTETKREIEVIPNIVSPLYQYREKEKKERFDFLAVGRLSEEKGYDKLIHAFWKAFKGISEVHLHIVGGGNEDNKLKSIISKYRAEERITLHGVMQKNELAEFYHKCDALVMPSDYETFGVPVAEAMACGLPVIVTQNTGVSFYVTEEMGIVIENNEVENIAKAMISLFRNISGYRSSKISNTAKAYFSEPVVYKLIIKLFSKAIRG